MTSYAPNVFKALNGFLCVYKPAGKTVGGVMHTLKINLARDLNAMECRPTRHMVQINEENLGTDLPVVTTVPDLADHPLVIGPRYILKDFKIKPASMLDKTSSGVVVLGIGRGLDLVNKFIRAQYMQVSHIRGQFGLATQDFTSTGRIAERSTYHHITQDRLDRILAMIQSSHQKSMFSTAGVDVQSQQAYELATKGVLRPKPGSYLPVIYNIKCIDFNPPDFTLEVHAINAKCKYLHELVHDIGLQLKSNAVSKGLRRLRHGHFTLENALLMKHWHAENLADNINLCRPLVAKDKLRHLPGMQDLDESKLQMLPDGSASYLELEDGY